MRFYLNVYSVNQSYGGPEEGGWYYHTGEFVRNIAIFSNEEEAALAQIVLQKRIDEIDNEPRGAAGDLNSVLCDGEFRVHLERKPGKDYPQQRPYYS